MFTGFREEISIAVQYLNFILIRWTVEPHKQMRLKGAYKY